MRTIVIELVVTGDADEAMAAADRALDAGSIQDALCDAADDDLGHFKIVNASARYGADR
jgi:hypothetical protein